MEKSKSQIAFENACKQLGHDPEKILPDFSMYPENHRKALSASAKLFIIIEAKNESKKPNYYKRQPRYFNWPDIKADENNPHGSGLSFGVRGDVRSYTLVGARLELLKREQVREVWDECEDLFTDLLLFT